MMIYKIAGYLLSVAGGVVIGYLTSTFGLSTIAFFGFMGGGVLLFLGGAFMSVARDRNNYLTQLQDIAKKLDEDKKS